MTALRERLLEVFEVEYREHIEAMRAMLAAAAAHVPGADALNEATRRAHTLKGAARAVGLADVEALAHGLESLFAQARAGDVELDADVRRQIADTLDEIEDCVAGPGTAGTQVPSAAEGGAATGDPLAASVRVGAAELDDLFRSAGELQADVTSQSTVAGDLKALQADIAQLGSALERRPSIDSDLRTIVRGLARKARVTAAAQRAAAAGLRGHVQRLDARVRAAGMLSAESVFGGFRKMVRDLALEEGKEVAVTVDGLDCKADRLVLQRLKDPVMHLLRNAVSHGVEPPEERRANGKAPEGRVRLNISAERGRLSIVVEDDGRGIDFSAVAARAVARGTMSSEDAAQAGEDKLAQLLFEPGFSTAREVTRISGRGVGLSVAREAVTDLDGTIALQRAPGGGTRIELAVPLSILARRLLLARFREQSVGIPCDALVRVLRVPLADIVELEGRPAVPFEGAPLPLRSLGDLLDLPETAVATEGARGLVVVVRAGAGKIGLVVEDLGVVGDFVVCPLDVATGGQRLWSGVTLTPDALPCLVLATGALDHIATRASGPLVFDKHEQQAPAAPRILVVDDSVTTRTLEKSILEAEGYRVGLSVDGADAIAQLRAEPADLVVSDIEMPRLDGFELLRAMKEDERLAEIPVILVTSRENPVDRERGLELGADAYVVKQRFDQAELLKTIRQVI